jgi:hypothetical protein
VFLGLVTLVQLLGEVTRSSERLSLGHGSASSILAVPRAASDAENRVKDCRSRRRRPPSLQTSRHPPVRACAAPASSPRRRSLRSRLSGDVFHGHARSKSLEDDPHMKCATKNCHALAGGRTLEGYCPKCWDYVSYLRQQADHDPQLQACNQVANRDPHVTEYNDSTPHEALHGAEPGASSSGITGS